jgi:hypothetical protein
MLVLLKDFHQLIIMIHTTKVLIKMFLSRLVQKMVQSSLDKYGLMMLLSQIGQVKTLQLTGVLK